MIRVEEAPEPADFDAVVRRPGLIAVAEMAGKAPPFARATGNPCKRRTHKVTQPDGSTAEVLWQREDEVPAGELPTDWTEALPTMKRAWDKAYEWRNYRLASSKMNARKGDFGAVLDPFDIKDHWFELKLTGFQVKPARGLPDALRDQIWDTVKRLRLNDRDCWKGRERDAERYWRGEVSLRVLREDSPFVARELHRQGRRLAGDIG